jgi:hypothetical protein
VEFQVPPSSQPPSGFSKEFTVTAGIDGKAVPQDDCAQGTTDVRIYKKAAGSFVEKGGGKLTASWHPEMDPPQCVYAELPGFKQAAGSVPSGEATDVYRVVIRSIGGEIVATVARKKSSK